MRKASVLGSIGFACAALWSAGGAPASQSFHFCILGDRTGETVPGVYEQVWREAAATHPSFVINAGDTIQGYIDSLATSQWRAVKPVWSKYPYPFHLTPGNHDIWSDYSRTVYESAAHRPAYYGFDYQNAHFTVLDNSRSFEMSPEQMGFLERDLQANRSRNPKFVFFHQPFWIIPLKLGNTDFPFHHMMLAYGVKYVVSGHTHQFSRMERDGVVYTVIGSSGGHLRGHDPMKDYDQGWFFQHIEVTVRSGEVRMQVRETGAPFGKARGFDAAAWTGG